MNEDEFERRLNEATRCGESSQARDPETAALAEGWQALGHLLESANADFRPELMIKQLRWRRMQRRLWRGGALLAASLLIGIGITLYVNQGGADNKAGAVPGGRNVIAANPAEKPARGDAASPKNDRPATVVKSQGTGKSPAPTLAASATKSEWDQSLDDQISEADDSVRAAETLASRSDDQIEQLDRQLTSFRQEVEASSL